METAFGVACIVALIFFLIIIDKIKSIEFLEERRLEDWERLSAAQNKLMEVRNALRLARHMVLTREPMDTKAGKMFSDALGEAWEPASEEFYRSPKAGQHFNLARGEQRDHCGGGCCSHGGAPMIPVASDETRQYAKDDAEFTVTPMRYPAQ